MTLAGLDKLTARERAGLAAALVCIAGLAIEKLAVGPLAWRFRELDTEIERTQANLLRVDHILTRKQKVDSEYAKVRDSLSSAGSPADEKDRMSRELDEMAKRCNLQCPSLETREPPAGPASFPLQEYSAQFAKFKGELSSLLQFLHDVDSAPGMMRVKTFKVVPDRENPGRMEGTMLVTRILLAPGVEEGPSVAP